MIRLCFAFAVVVLLAATAPALAQDGGEVTDDDVNRVARQIYCPQCENVTLDVCGTSACIDWRHEIRQYMQDGWTDQQIIDYFVEQYGQRVLAKPNDPTISFLLVAIPLAVAAAAVAGVVWLWYKGRQAAPTQPTAPVTPAAPTPPAPADETPKDDDYYRERLERELDEVS
jgi:cytochrome c-type biogenesis protein CcmH